MKKYFFDDIEDIAGYLLSKYGQLSYTDLHRVLTTIHLEYENLYGNDNDYPEQLFERNNNGFMPVFLPKHKLEEYYDKYKDSDREFIRLTEKYFRYCPEIEILINVFTKQLMDRWNYRRWNKNGKITRNFTF